MQELKSRAKALRHNQTPQEQKLWTIIRNKQFYGFKFLRQYVINPYIVDFICREEKIIIEIDGGQHNQADAINYDNTRTIYLENLGYNVIRFWNTEIESNIDGVYETLQKIFEVS